MRAQLIAQCRICYSDQDQTALIEQIQQKFAGYVPTQTDYNGILSLLQMRTQCKEFADRMVIKGGGTAKPYYGPNKQPATPSANPRPGMYAFWKVNAHAAIITEIKFDSSGHPYAHLAESNWDVVWSNPRGQIPWLRTVTVGRGDADAVPIGDEYKAVATN